MHQKKDKNKEPLMPQSTELFPASKAVNENETSNKKETLKENNANIKSETNVLETIENDNSTLFE